MLDQITQQPTVDTRTFRLPEGEYVNQSVPKDLIVLHFTAGTSARSVYSTWTQRPGGAVSRVATAYVVDLDGSIYEFFPADRWAYHLGMTVRNPASFNDRRSVGIEIVNPGPLRLDSDSPDQLNWWPNSFSNRWCAISETDRYVRADYRGYRYFATFPKVQVEAVRRLTGHLCDRFQIPKVLPPANRRNEFDPNFYCSFRGIASHQNFRADKCDVGPAWNWGSLA